MAEDSTLLRAVKTLNPVRLEQVPESDTLREKIRLRVEAETETVASADVVPKPISRPARRILAGAAAAMVLVIGVVTLSQQDPPDAYASWTTTPTQLSPASMTATEQMCPPPEIPGDGRTVDVTPILAEQRGDYRLLLSVGEDAANSWCFVWPDSEADRGYRSQGEGVVWGTPPPAPESDGIEVLAAHPWEPGLETAPITIAMGAAGADVTGVTVSTADGSFAEATVSEGWWIVWFPERVEFGDTITVTTDDGTHETEMPSDL